MLDLGGGFKRIFSGFKSCWAFLLRFVVWASVLYACLSTTCSELAFLAGAEPQLLTTGLGRAWKDLVFGFFLVATLLGGADLLVQRLKFKRELGMTYEELQKELKEDEGDPHVKGNRQAMQRALTYGEVMQRVRQAKVIVVERRA
jgi:flagellar biosynthesis protein FlhB